jgi:copper homeostasis protein CutC
MKYRGRLNFAQNWQVIGAKTFAACVDLEGAMALLVERGGGRTLILCGCGVRLAELTKILGLREFHSAARRSVTEPVDGAEVAATKALLR